MAIFLKNVSTTTPTFNSELDAYNYLQTTMQSLRQKGYIACNVDTSYYINNTFTAQIFVGNLYKWANIKTSNIPPILLANLGYTYNTFNGKIINYNQYALLCKKILQYAQNNGYPFANVQLKNAVINDSTITGDITFTKNNLIKIDSIDIRGDANININYIERYLNIAEGDLYNEAQIASISKRIEESYFLKEAQPWVMRFSADKNTLTLFLDEKNANRADAVVGFLPNNTQLGGKLLVTGDVKLNLVNGLNRGEQININWQNLQYKSPRLMLDINLPYMFGTVFGISSKFNYIKNDTSFRSVMGELGVQYMFGNYNFLRAYYNSNTSRLLNVDLNQLQATRALPVNIDFNTKTFGLALAQANLNNRLNPSKGFSTNLEFGAAIKNIIRNNTIEEAYDAQLLKPFAYLYDTLKAKTFRYTAIGQFTYYFKLSKSFVLKTNYSGGIVLNERLFKNELFQIGGYKILRGFDEASLFVDKYSILTLEPHYNISRSSYLLLLADAGVVNLPFASNGKNKTAYAIGTGINLETKNGMFSLIYAISNNLSNNFVLKNGKIHFGYVSTF